jgi:hypothetical protein
MFQQSDQQRMGRMSGLRANRLVQQGIPERQLVGIVHAAGVSCPQLALPHEHAD